MKALLTFSILALVLAGCESNKSSLYPENTAGKPAATTASANEKPAQQEAPKPDEFKMPTPKDGDDVAIMDTTEGKIIIGFLKDKAPKTVDNFIALTKKKFYDGVKFHRTVPGFMIQFGDPNTKKGAKETWGTGGPGYTIEDEFNDTPHVRGILSMANTGSPNSAGSQFFIVVADSNFLDGKYTAFGYVIKGMDIADKIVNAPAEMMPGGPDSKPSSPIKPVVAKSVTMAKWPVK